MDFKEKIAQWGGKAKQLWSGICGKCGPAIEKGKALWSKARIWLGKAKEWILRAVEFLKEKGREIG